MPDYDQRAQSFAERALAVIRAEFGRAADGAERLLGVRPHSSDLPATDRLLAEVTAKWDYRLSVIWNEWSQQNHLLPAIIQGMEDWLLQELAGKAAEVGQSALGFVEYTWHTRDDDRVRPEHRSRDEQVFAWGHPPPDGHPGQDYNCRCTASPSLPPDDDAKPLTGAAFTALWLGAELDGSKDATLDAATNVAMGVWESLVALSEGVRALPGQIYTAGRFTRLIAEEQLGTLSPEEAAELARMRASVTASFDRLTDLFRDAPEIAAALRDYLVALHQRPDLVDEAYAKGLATEGDVRQAHYDRAYFDQTVLLGLIPAAVLAKLLERLGAAAGLARTLPGSASAAKLLRDGLALLRRTPWDADWPEIPNGGIRWGEGIRAQGLPWEDMLEKAGGLGARTAPTFKAYDFWDSVTGTATSAKTIDLAAFSYRTRPTTIYSQIMRYLDDMVRFEHDGKGQIEFANADILHRKLLLAIPQSASPEQIVQIRRAIEQAESLGIEMKVQVIAP